MSFRTMHEDYLDPDKYFGKPPDEPTKPPIHWAIRKLVRRLVGSNGLGSFYRAVYKGTACGPSIGFLIDGKWVYCDSLYDFDNEVIFSPMPDPRLRKAGYPRFHRFDRARKDRFFWHNHTVTGISVSSIVEGSDAEVPGEHITGDNKGYEALSQEFWKTVEFVNDEACHLWERDNSMWLILHHEEHGPIYWKMTAFDDGPDFYDGDRDLIPDEILSLTLRLIDNWCSNCAYDAIEVKDGWTVSAYEVND